MPEPTTDSVQDLLTKIFNSSDWRREIEITVKRNLKLLRRNKELQGENEQLKAAAPADGAKVLTKDEFTEFEAFRALKLKPDQITAVVAERDTLKGKQAELDEEKNYQDAAEALEFENVPALTRWLKREGLALEFQDKRSKNEDGKNVVTRVPMVRPKADAKAVLEPLADYIEREVPEFVDTFKASPVAAESEGDESDEQEAPVARIPKGTVAVPATRSAGRTSVGSRDKKVLEDIENEYRNNPLYSM